MFEKFRKFKRKQENNKRLKDLDQEYKIELQKVTSFLYSDGYAFMTDYFEAKAEILRDGLEIRNPNCRNDLREMTMINAELSVIRSFLADLQGMKEQLAMEEEMQRVNNGVHK